MEGVAYLCAAGAARLAQNIPKFLQVGADRGVHLQRCVEPGPEPARGRMSPRAISEGGRDPDPARFSPSARVAAPSGPSREPPPTAVRHFNTLPACPRIRELGVGVAPNQRFQPTATFVKRRDFSMQVPGWR